MGDVAMLPHAVRALKEAYPQLKVTVASRPLFRPFFAGLDVDFLEVDTKGSEHSLLGMWRLARKAREMGVDAVADAHEVMRSEAFRLSMWLHGIPVAYIRKGRMAKKAFIRKGGRGCLPLKPTVVRYVDVLRRLGFEVENPVPACKTERPNPMGEKTTTWVGFAPFSAQKGKTYPEDLSRELVALLSARFGRVFIHSGGGQEQAFAQEMEQKYENVTALFGKVKLEGEMNVISHLDCVISMDSLVMHLASLMATPCVSVWGATHPDLGFLGWGGDADNVLQADMECRPCSVFGAKPCKYGDYRCMRAVSPQQILEKVEQVVGR